MNDKVGIIDIRAKINDQDLVNIEMQILDNKDIEKRVLYYWAKLYSKQLKKGEKYTKLEKLKVRKTVNHIDKRFRDSYNRITQDKEKVRKWRFKKVDSILRKS